MCGLIQGEKSIGYKLVLAGLLHFSLINHSCIFAAESPEDSESYAIGFTVLEFRNQFGDPDQERSKGTGKVASSPSGEAYSIKFAYSGTPKYREAGTFGYQNFDYDDDGNLAYWRPIEKLGFQSGLVNRSMIVSEGLGISPDGSVIRRTVQTKVVSSPLSDKNPYLENFWRCAGLTSGTKGFTIEKRSIIDSKVVFESQQSFKGISTGYWSGVIDLPTGLVRRAELIPIGRTHPTTEIITTGTLTNGPVTIAEEGQTLDVYESGAHFDMLRIDLSSQEAFVQETCDKLNGPFASGVIVREE